MSTYYEALETEKVNENTRNIDLCTTMEMVTLMNREDAAVPEAVKAELPRIARAVDLLYEALTHGGRMIYLGAGTSGRLGILDASECPPTFSTLPELVQGYIAGGDAALRRAVEGCEDSVEQGVQIIEEAGVTGKDAVIGITASGSAPFVLAAIEEARRRGAVTVGVVTNAGTRLEKLCDVCIAPVVGAEVITGSTRLKSGTAQKLVLNMLSTCTMIKLGKVYGNLMVDLNPSNTKLLDRAIRIIRSVAGVENETASRALEEAGNNTKLAIMMLKSGLPAKEAEACLGRSGGVLRRALQECGCAGEAGEKEDKEKDCDDHCGLQ